METANKQRNAEALVHMSYGRTYAKALDSQASVSAPQHRKEAAAGSHRSKANPCKSN